MRAPEVLLLLVAAAASIDATIYDVTAPTEWWQATTLYQIWPRSFKDSDGDGIGDLNGITSKLEYFAEMGFETVWLSPFFKSPLADSGYDVSDYRDVNPIYGSLDDLKILVDKAHELGLKVVLDFVPNHTSDEHEWFIKSKACIEPYTDYYVWNEGILDANGTRQPPNNWLSLFNSGSTWEWVEERQAYYLHQFHVKQPDLNLSNSLVIDETKDIMTYWLDFGIDGFRIDAVPYLFEDELLRDEPESGRAGVKWPQFGYLRHIYVKDNPKNFDIVQVWRNHIDSYNAAAGDEPPRIMVTEAYGEVSSVMKLYDSGADFSFNFLPIRSNALTPYEYASDIVDTINQWMGNMPANRTANWVFGNHDNTRVATKYGVERVDAINFLLFLLPGVATIYNGDELGMTDTYLTWEQTEDPQACNTDETRYAQFNRDPERTPFQWDNSTSAGFSTNSTTMLPVNENYFTVNVATEKEVDVSHLKNVQALIQLRNTPVIREGSLDVSVIDDDIIAFSRELDGELPIVVLINWNTESSVTFSLEEFEDIPDTLEVLVADIYSGIAVGDAYDKTCVTLPANAAVVLQGIDCS